jgi:hypothetical protein
MKTSNLTKKRVPPLWSGSNKMVGNIEVPLQWCCYGFRGDTGWMQSGLVKWGHKRGRRIPCCLQTSSSFTENVWYLQKQISQALNFSSVNWKFAMHPLLLIPFCLIHSPWYVQKPFILWPIDLLLGKILEINNEKSAVAMQWCGKHASTIIELLLETVFSTRSVQRGYKEDNWGDPVSCCLSPSVSSDLSWERAPHMDRTVTFKLESRQ